MNLNNKVAEVLEQLGFSSIRIGYTYILEAVVYMVACNGEAIGVTKTLYPYLAKKFATSSQAVERAMRMAISDACQIGNDNIRRLTGAESNCRLHFTNKEFIYKTVNCVKKQLEISNN